MNITELIITGSDDQQFICCGLLLEAAVILVQNYRFS